MLSPQVRKDGKMDFKKYINKYVKIYFTDGEIFEGIPYCFSGADDNDEGIASIRINGYEFYENEINNIEIIAVNTPNNVNVV